MSSIRRRLLLGLLSLVAAGIALAGWLVYRQAQAEANALFDYQLRETAAALPPDTFASILGDHADTDGGMVIQIWSRDGVKLYYSHPRASLAPRAELGYSTEDTPNGAFRVYSAIVGNNVVQLAQPMAVRNSMAARTAWRTIWPLLVLLPLLGVLVWRVVGRELRPLQALAHALDARAPETLAPLSVPTPVAELAPLIGALNGLLGRLAQSHDAQRAFVADAAHELRTPLAALRVQVQWLERAPHDAARQSALADLSQGVSRAVQVVEQLLALARAEPQPGSAEPAAQIVAMRELVESAVSECVPLAISRDIDLGVEQAEDVSVRGEPEALRVLMRNLLDNALKYTPPGGRVDVRLHRQDAARGVLEIADSGAGIPEAERARVFDRFYRGEQGARRAPGSGLGLSIVRRIAERHGLLVSLHDRGVDAAGTPLSGLCVRVELPLVQTATR